jgi:hypothetical protein
MYACIEGTKIIQNYEIRKRFREKIHYFLIKGGFLFHFRVVFRIFAASNGQKDSKNR